MTIIILILKVRSRVPAVRIAFSVCWQLPTALASLAALRQRGAQFSGLGFRGSDLAGATGMLLDVTSLFRSLIPSSYSVVNARWIHLQWW